MTSKVVLVADYGRSGQGWLSYMLCYILNAAFVEPYDFLAGRSYTNSGHVLGLTQGNLPGRERTNYSMIIKTHYATPARLTLTDKVIVLIRDPRDVAVSAYFRFRKMRGEGGTRPLRSKLFGFLKANRFTNLLTTYFRWVRFYRAWWPTDHYLVRYEDLLIDPQGILRGILAYLDVHPDERQVEDAVREFSFATITGRQRGQEDNNNPEFRKGIAGDFANRFSKLELRLFGLYAGIDGADFGYDLGRAGTKR